MVQPTTSAFTILCGFLETNEGFDGKDYFDTYLYNMQETGLWLVEVYPPVSLLQIPDRIDKCV